MDVAALEQAGEAILAPPNVVTSEQRKAAEAVFTDLKQTLSIDGAQQILQSTQHPFVLHQIGQTTGEIVLRDWAILQPSQAEAVYKMLIEFTAARESIPSYVVAEFLRSAAMIVKRGAIDKKTGDPQLLYDTIKGLLSHSDARMQSIGVQLISSICEQFSSSWRNSKFSITWDFHLSAKTEFEKTGLRRLLEMAVSTLHNLISNSDILANPFERRLCEKFLEVAECAFSWNFSARLFRRIFSMHTTSTSFRPPGSWGDFLKNDDFLLLFFQLHGKVRSDPDISIHSLACLVQLASLSGDIVSDSQYSQHFVELFVTNILDLFPQGPLPHEVDHFCTIFNRLFMYRPVQSLMRLPPVTRTRFFTYVTEYMQHLTTQALHEAIGESRHLSHASLVSLFDSWNIVLRGKWTNAIGEEEAKSIEESLIAGPTWAIIQTFIQATQSAPNGNRPPEGAKGDDADDDDDESREDRQLYSDLLLPLGNMACYTCPQFMSSMTSLLRQQLGEFSAMAEGSVDASRLPLWQEDMHWLMLINANSLVGEDIDGSCHIQAEVYDHSIALCQQRGGPFPEDARDAFLTMAINDPTANREASAGHVDPFIILVGELLAWASLEQQLLTSSVASEMISPELCRSTSLVLRRFLNSMGNKGEPDEPETVCYPLLPLSGPVSDLITSFILTKSFTILTRFSGEKKLCGDAVSMLEGLVESRAPALASSPVLFSSLSSLDIARCPVRAELMKVLVLIGAASNNDDLRQNMFKQILEPLSTRYSGVVASHSSSSSAVDSDLVDLLQCFDGVARASLPHSANVLFNMLHPVLATCAPLVRSSQSAPVVTAVLSLMQDVTTKVSIYLDEKEDSAKLYSCLLDTVDAYRATHGQRFVGMSSDDEEKAADLVLFMNILSNVLSNDILEDVNDRQLSGSRVAMTSLEMLLCVMSESLLQHPEVALKFYRLLLYLTEFCPESLAFMNEQLLNSLCECLSAGLTSKFGNEITSVCLESLGEVAGYFTVNRDKCTVAVQKHFHSMLPTVFAACLENSAEASLFSEACGSLYCLICFDTVYFNQFVQELLQRKSNQEAASRLTEAFTRLFPDTPELGRKQRISFRQRMEKFLGEIQGLLWIS